MKHKSFPNIQAATISAFLAILHALLLETKDVAHEARCKSPSPLVHQNLCQSLSSLLSSFETGDVNHQSRQLRDPPQQPLAGRPRPRPPSRQALHQVGRCRRRRARSIIMRRAAVAAAHRQQAARPTDRTAGEPYTSHITHRPTRTDGADRNFRDAEGFEKHLDGFREAIFTKITGVFRLRKVKHITILYPFLIVIRLDADLHHFCTSRI